MGMIIAPAKDGSRRDRSDPNPVTLSRSETLPLENDDLRDGPVWQRIGPFPFQDAAFRLVPTDSFPMSGKAFVQHQKERQNSMAKAIAIINMTDAMLATELSAVNRKIELGMITWENASKELRSCPFGAFNHTGKIISVVETAEWSAAVAVQLRVESERRNGGSLASVKAGHQKKAETASVTVRTTGLKAAESTVTVQLALAQGLAERARKIGVEISGRKERQAAADAITAEMEATKAAKELKAEAASYAVAEAVEAGDVDVAEVDALNMELVEA